VYCFATRGASDNRHLGDGGLRFCTESTSTPVQKRSRGTEKP
jgi:hypothetical protein